MNLEIFILNWNRKESLKKCLDSLLNHGQVPVTIVDNHSTDGSLEMLDQDYPQVKVITLKHNLGVSALNKGYQIASSDIIVNIDNDMILESSSMTWDQVVRYFDEHPKCGCVGFKILNVDGQVSGDSPKHILSNDSLICSTFDGGGFAFRKSLFEEIGGFSEDIFIYHNEYEWSLRMWDSGYEIHYFPKVTLTHLHDKESRLSTRDYYAHNQQNYMYCIWKHFPLKQAIIESFRFLKKCFVEFRVPICFWLPLWRGMILGLNKRNKTVSLFTINKMKYIAKTHAQAK